MPSSPKSTHIDRDDFDADHYADFMRDTHRSRLTLDQLDIAQRQFRKKEKLLSHIHYLKMKEHDRVKNEFMRKVEQDLHISNLSSVKETLKSHRRQHLQPLTSSISCQHSQETTKSTRQEKKSHELDNYSKITTRYDSPRTERLKANIDKFNHTNSLLN